MPAQPLTRLIPLQALLLVIVMLGAGLGCTPPRVVAAAKRGELAVVEALISRGEDVDRTDASGQTALMWAVSRNDRRLVETLMTAGASVDAQDVEGQTALMRAAHRGGAELARALLASGARVDARDRWGQTALRIAACSPNIQTETALALLEHGADPDVANAQGEVPLWQAVLRGHGDVALRLLDGGASGSSRQAQTGLTLLMVAASMGHEQLTAALIERGAEVDARDRTGGRSALLTAARNGHAGVTRELLQRGADLNVRTLEGGLTPLMLAATRSPTPHARRPSGDHGVAQLLLEGGADPELRDHRGKTALEIAKLTGNRAVANALLTFRSGR